VTEMAALRPGLRTALLVLTIALGSASSALGQGFISPFAGYNFGGDAGCPEIAGCEDKNLNLGISFGSIGSVFGAELEIAHASDFFGETPGVSSSVLSVMGNLMLAPKFGFVQPYGLIGLGLLKTNVELDVAGLLDSDNNHLGWNIGGGLILFFGDHFGVRGDVRYFHAFQDLTIVGIALGSTKLDFGRAAGGVIFKF
jgi:opacity protein-like surface antigen